MMSWRGMMIYSGLGGRGVDTIVGSCLTFITLLLLIVRNIY